VRWGGQDRLSFEATPAPGVGSLPAREPSRYEADSASVIGSGYRFEATKTFIINQIDFNT
jgi:hypothetical protein